MREQFLNELDELHADVIEIMELVIVAFRNSVTSLLNGDVDLANEVIEGDDVIDAACIGIEERSLEVIATQSPVARDLRLLISLTYVVWHLERMADLSVNIARAARRTQGMHGAQTLCDLIQAQGNLVHRVLETTLDALQDKDIELALKLPELDEPIDQLYKQFFRELARLTDEEEIEWASSMVLASRYLERISDNAVDIGERIAYMVTGDREQAAIDSAAT